MVDHPSSLKKKCDPYDIADNDNDNDDRQVCLIDGFLLILIMRPMKHKEKEDGKEKPQV